jgi:hypothetical protein
VTVATVHHTIEWAMSRKAGAAISSEVRISFLSWLRELRLGAVPGTNQRITELTVRAGCPGGNRVSSALRIGRSLSGGRGTR